MLRRRAERQTAPKPKTPAVIPWTSIIMLEEKDAEPLIVHFVRQAYIPEGTFLAAACGKQGQTSSTLTPGRRKEFCSECAPYVH